jgi:hypothetical protein
MYEEVYIKKSNGEMEWEGEEEHILEVPELKIC